MRAVPQLAGMTKLTVPSIIFAIRKFLRPNNHCDFRMTSPALYVADMDSHTMRMSLLRYVTQKVHPDIRDGSWSQINIVGSLQRNAPARIASFEHHARSFNFQRPTITITDPRTVQLNCFPSRSYVQHYASVVATYLSLTGRDPTIVRAILPTESDTLRVLLQSNIEMLGLVDIVVVGEVYKLKKFVTDTWQGEGSSLRDLFRWQKFLSPKGRTIALLGCLENVWGEAGGCLVRVLQQLAGVKCVLYVGKVGALHPNYAPNEWIATGTQTSVEDKSITWRSPLDNTMLLSNQVVQGSHITVPSLLCETQTWLRKWEATCAWVDCEVGYMAEAAKDVGAEFGYLHIVSDNLKSVYPEDLSNEDLAVVMSKRKLLYQEIELILESLFARWDPPHRET